MKANKDKETKKSSKKNNNIYKIGIVLVLILLVGFAYFYLNGNDEKKTVGEAKKEDEIKKDEYNYVLYGHKSDLYKEYFKELKKELLKDGVNEEEYAKLISKLFVADFYSLDDKVTSTDIGGLDFIHENIKENFVLKASDTIYKYVESNVYEDRKQSLPKVTKVEIKTITKSIITKDDLKDENGYKVVATVTYEKDMSYPKEVNLTIVHKDKKLYIIDVK